MRQSSSRVRLGAGDREEAVQVLEAVLAEEPGQEGAEDKDGGAHGPDELIGRLIGADLGDAKRHFVVRGPERAAEIGDQGQDGLDVLHPRDVGEADFLARQEGGGDGRQDGVLGPAHADFAREPESRSALDEELVHRADCR